MKPGAGLRRALGAAVILAALAAAAAVAAGLWVRIRMSASLARLDGAAAVPGLASPVQVARDPLGVPTVSAASRIDVARATGWLHAQDRFFQMDLMRRRASGELAELFGAAAVPLDRAARMHGFRKLAAAVLAQEKPERRALAAAYADGVNAGLAALGAKPWEYSVLRSEPRPWAPEDCILVCYSMTLDLEQSAGEYPRTLADIRDQLGPASLAFFAPLYTGFDAAIDASTGPRPPIPPPAEIDLRGKPSATTAVPGSLDWQSAGSNGLAITARGGPAIVANDMHLHLGVPNTWYRMRLVWPGHDETGVTLPGTPVMVAGSTGRVAWGFTVANAGTGDVVLVGKSISPDLYHGPGGISLLPYEKREETIEVRGAKPVQAGYLWTIWGPVVGDAPNGRQYAYHWTADDPEATNLGLMDMEDARNVGDAVRVAHRAGIPALNIIVADSGGVIAWTVAGKIPKRLGYDGRLPVPWDFGDRKWEGYMTSEVPTVMTHDGGFLWTANNRTLGGKYLQELGDSGYDLGARAGQIRDDLALLASSGRPAAPKDLLAIELDDRALFLARWHDLLLATLSPGAVAARPRRQALLEAARNWDGLAGTDSVGYRVVRGFRLAATQRILGPIFAPCAEADPDFSLAHVNTEPAVEAILEAKPAHLLDPRYASWDDLLLAAADDVSGAYAGAHLDPRKATWGERNVAEIDHPLARALPRWASAWLCMPRVELPGDSNMPRIQQVDFGASERFAVSPGHEDQGIIEMAGGQSANPLSPYFRAGFDSWARGDPAPFLPGPTVHSLELRPDAR